MLQYAFKSNEIDAHEKVQGSSVYEADEAAVVGSMDRRPVFDVRTHQEGHFEQLL